MSDGGEWFKLSRRDFAKAAALSIVTSTAAGKVSAMSQNDEPTTQPQPSDALIESRVKWLEDQLGRAIPPNLRATVAKQIAVNDAMWKRGRGFAVPDGTEPAFVFQPVKPGEKK